MDSAAMDPGDSIGGHLLTHQNLRPIDLEEESRILLETAAGRQTRSGPCPRAESSAPLPLPPESGQVRLKIPEYPVTSHQPKRTPRRPTLCRSRSATACTIGRKRCDPARF